MPTADDPLRSIEYVRVDGEHGSIAPGAILRVSQLTDGRGVIYVKAGGIIVIRDVAAFLARFSASRD